MKKIRNIVSAYAQTLFFVFIYAICFLLPFQPRFLATVEILTVVFFIIGYSPLKIGKNIITHKIGWPFFLFFLLVALSCFYSQDKEEAARQFEVKLAFLVIPLLLIGSGLSKEKAKTGVISFVAGCAAACIVLLVWATYDYLKTNNTDVFVYAAFSRFMHVSYFSMYLLICFGILFMIALEDKLLFPKAHYVLMILYVVCLVLISAKIMLLAFIASSFLFAGYYAKRKKKIHVAVGIILSFLVMPILLYFLSPNLKIRVDFFVSELKKYNQEVPPSDMGSATLRMVIWKDALPEIKSNLPFGVGIGDVKNSLLENYEKRNMKYAIERKFNMHNEYLQVLAGIGILGFLCLLVLFILPSFICAPPYRFIGILLSFSVSTVALTESIFERQAGTIFICLIGILLMIAYGKEQKQWLEV